MILLAIVLYKYRRRKQKEINKDTNSSISTSSSHKGQKTQSSSSPASSTEPNILEGQLKSESSTPDQCSLDAPYVLELKMMNPPTLDGIEPNWNPNPNIAGMIY